MWLILLGDFNASCHELEYAQEKFSAEVMAHFSVKPIIPDEAPTNISGTHTL